ncbi:MAG: hypothetical protein GKR95_19725 [Gammaproteobacteria bacterium]|nr:hypothetical protein [Gammaproteobacteria bacterium]
MKILIGLLLTFCLSYPATTVGEISGGVRAYQLNKKGQLKKQDWTKKASPDVCTNFRKEQKAHRFAQTRYQYCMLFSVRECDETQSLMAMWGGDKYRVKGMSLDVAQPQGKLYRGTKWMLHPKENVIVRSIYCRSRS